MAVGLVGRSRAARPGLAAGRPAAEAGSGASSNEEGVEDAEIVEEK